MAQKLKFYWTAWKYAIGSFSDEQTAEYDDIVALIRTIVVGLNLLCAIFIMTNILRNW